MPEKEVKGSERGCAAFCCCFQFIFFILMALYFASRIVLCDINRIHTNEWKMAMEGLDQDGLTIIRNVTGIVPDEEGMDTLVLFIDVLLNGLGMGASVWPTIAVVLDILVCVILGIGLCCLSMSICGRCNLLTPCAKTTTKLSSVCTCVGSLCGGCSCFIAVITFVPIYWAALVYSVTMLVLNYLPDYDNLDELMAMFFEYFPIYSFKRFIWTVAICGVIPGVILFLPFCLSPLICACPCCLGACIELVKGDSGSGNSAEVELQPSSRTTVNVTMSKAQTGQKASSPPNAVLTTNPPVGGVGGGQPQQQQPSGLVGFQAPPSQQLPKIHGYGVSQPQAQAQQQQAKVEQPPQQVISAPVYQPPSFESGQSQQQQQQQPPQQEYYPPVQQQQPPQQEYYPPVQQQQQQQFYPQQQPQQYYPQQSHQPPQNQHQHQHQEQTSEFTVPQFDTHSSMQAPPPTMDPPVFGDSEFDIHV